MPHPFLKNSKNISIPCVEYQHQQNRARNLSSSYDKLSEYSSQSTNPLYDPSAATLPYAKIYSSDSKFDWKKLYYDVTEKARCSKKLPRQRSNFAACSDGSSLFVQGGIGNNVSFRDFWRFDFASRIWTEIEPRSAGLPSGLPLLRDHCMVHYGSKVFIIGGNLVDLDLAVPIWCYNILFSSFERLPVPLSSSSSSSSNSPQENRFYPLTCQRSKSSKLALPLPSNLTSHSAVLLNNCIVVYGGYKHIYGCSGELWMFNLDYHKWSLLYLAKDNSSSSKGPPPLYKHRAVVYQNEMFIFFGRRNNGSYNNDVWAFNCDRMTWRKINQNGQIPPNLTDCDLQVVGSNAVCIGGKGENGEFNQWNYLFLFSGHKWKTTDVCNDSYAVYGPVVLCVSISPSSIDSNDYGTAHQFSVQQRKQIDVGTRKKIYGKNVCSTKNRNSQTVGLNGIIDVVSNPCLSSVDLIPKKKTIFQNAMFKSSNFVCNPGERENEMDVLVDTEVISKEKSLDVDGLANRLKSFSKSFPRLDKLSQEHLDYSLKSTESANFLSMDSLVPILYRLHDDSACDDDAFRTNLDASELKNGYDNLCYLEDSFDNPRFYGRHLSEVSNGRPTEHLMESPSSYTRLNAEVKRASKSEERVATLLLIGGFEESYIPGKSSTLEISYCHLDAETDCSGNLCSQNPRTETYF